MRAIKPSTAKVDCDKALLARSITEAAQRAEGLGFAEAALLLRRAQAMAEQAAEAGRVGSVN